MSTDITLLLQPRGRAARPLEGGMHSGSPARARQGQPQPQAFASLLSKAEAARHASSGNDTGTLPSDDKRAQGAEAANGRETERYFTHAAGAAISEPMPREGTERSSPDETSTSSDRGEDTASALIGLLDVARQLPTDVTRQSIVRLDHGGPSETLAGHLAESARTTDHPEIADGHTRADVPLRQAVAREPGLAAIPSSADALAARVVVERIEAHHAPVSNFERQQAMSGLQHGPVGPAQPLTTSDRTAASDDTAHDVGEIERKPDTIAGRERVAGSEQGTTAERWRPDRRGDLFSGSGGRRQWDSSSPAPSAASATGVAGPESTRQDFAAARDASPQPGALVAPIAGSLLAAVEDMHAAEVASTHSTAGPQLAVPSGAPVKSLDLTLQPDQLGPIAVRMRLENGALTISMKAHNHGDTAALVVEREAIEDSLRKSGHAIDAITVSIAAEPVSRPAESGPSQQATYQGGGDVGGGRSEAMGTGGRDRDGQRPPSADGMAGRQGSDARTPATDQNSRRGPGLYV